MNFKIRAGSVDEVRRGSASGDWIFVDLGFAKDRQRTCGIVKGDGPAGLKSYGELLILLVEKAQTRKPDGRQLNVLIEAPLSGAFSKDGNPVGRCFERQKDSDGKTVSTRYWYMNSGASMFLASIRLIGELASCGIQRNVRLFEGFLSFKLNPSNSSHAKDAMALRDAVLKSNVAPCVLGRDELDRPGQTLESVFDLAGIKGGGGIPPVVVVAPEVTS